MMIIIRRCVCVCVVVFQLYCLVGDRQGGGGEKNNSKYNIATVRIIEYEWNNDMMSNYTMHAATSPHPSGR